MTTHTTVGGDGARTQLLAGLSVREHRLELAGVSTAVLEGGAGRPVVLLHGPLANASHWMRVIPALTSHHRVVVPDLPGHGASIVDGPLTSDRVMAWLGALIERTCASPPALVGQTLGGAIAARFASARGERLRSLVLADTLGLTPFQPAREFGLALSDFMSRPDSRSYRELWTLCAHDLDGLREAMGEQWSAFESYNIDRARTPSVMAAVDALMKSFALPIPDEVLRGITVPTTLIWGRHDLATPLAVAEAASARHGWRLHVIEDANDDPPMERPDDFVDALRDALASSLSPSRTSRTDEVEG
jgi:pimeloyl-ACP methyl ester carboxylesterase